MFHLLANAVNPALLLEESVKNWFQISCALRESARERGMQIEE